MREKAARLERAAAAHEQGAEGEAATAEALKALSNEWVVLHDLRWPGRRFANIDHVVIGPGGVFVIDSKNWSGQVKLDGRTIRQNGRSRHKAVAGCARAAIDVGQLVPLYIDHVYPVLCFEGREIAGSAYEVMVCSTGNVAETLMSRPRVFGQYHVEYVHLALKASMTSATHEDRHNLVRATRATSVLPPAKPATTQVRRPGRRKPKFSLGRALGGVALLTVAFVPQLRDGFAGLVTDIVVPEKPASSCEPQSPDAADQCAKEPAEMKPNKAKNRKN